MKFIKNHKIKILWLFLLAGILTATYFWEDASYNEQKEINQTSRYAQEKKDDEDKKTQENLPENAEKEEKKQAVPVKEDVQNSVSHENNEKPKEHLVQADAEKTVKDMYNTDHVPEGKPQPIEPQSITISDKEMNCTLTIRCDVINQNIESLAKEKRPLVPSDGMILNNIHVTFYEGESVFNVLLRETRKNKIHMEYVNVPIYNSAYIEGINNLYEFDCGNLSGWMYSVNGYFPGYGSSRYQLREGDHIEWVYTCDLGRDIK